MADRLQRRSRSIDNFTFVGRGIDPHPPRDVPVSVDHDKWHAEAVASRWEEPDDEPTPIEKESS